LQKKKADGEGPADEMAAIRQNIFLPININKGALFNAWNFK